MATSSSASAGPQKKASSEQYQVPFRTLLTPVKNLKVLSELIIDFGSLKENGFDLTEEVRAQKWERYFDRLVGPTFPMLVKEFWIHAKASTHLVTSFVMGKKIVITEDHIARLIGYSGGGVRCVDMAERCDDVGVIAARIFTHGVPSSKIKDLKDHYRVWAKIILGCFNHRKPTSSPDYINVDQQFLIYFIDQKVKINLAHFLFNHLRTSVKETREEERTKRDWIPFGRLISDILTENRLIEHLIEAQELSTIEPIVGKPLNAKNLKKMKLIENIQKEPRATPIADITNRRVPLSDFPLFSEIESKPEVVLRYLDACKADGTDPNLIIKALHQPQQEVTLKKTKKRKAPSEGSSQQTPKKRGNLSAASVLNSSTIPASIPPQTSHRISIPIPTIDETVPEDDPSEALKLRRPRTKHPKPTISTTSAIDKVLSDIDQHTSDQPNSEPQIVPPPQPEQQQSAEEPEQQQPLSSVPEEPLIPEQPEIPTTSPQPAIPSPSPQPEINPPSPQPEFHQSETPSPQPSEPHSPQPSPLAIQLPGGTTITLAQLPSSPESTPPNTPKTPPSPIIIFYSETPSPKQTAAKKTSENPSRTFIDLTSLDRLADLKHKIAIPKPKQPDVGSGIMNFETCVQQWIASLKQVCPGMIDPAASDQLWSQFRLWVRAEALKLQDINYEQAQHNFSKLLNEVGSQLLKEDVLPLDSEPWSEKQLASKVQPEEDKTIQVE
ncbi:unnamed protein product [Vicia faba]|uniref:Putative plant transposon protein domain-containing protein n=1 Tax=Vicia faba TaxID=3906 RepID=A0AAV1AWW7_VICFA|nr:unnamed protein product [Vicia faba]